MKSHLTALIASSLLTCLVAAQGDDGVGNVSGTKNEAWAQFLVENGSGWTAAWNRATGTPEAIWGDGMRLQPGPISSNAQARHLSEMALERYRELLGLGTSNFVEEIGTKVARVHIFVYRQRFKGLPVVGGRADIRIHDNGVLSMLGSQAMPIPATFNVSPRVSSEEAKARALAHLGVASRAQGWVQPKSDRLVIWGDPFAKVLTPVKLAWEVQVDSAKPEMVGRAYVDAQSGQFLRYETDLHECGFGGCEHDHAASEAASDTEVDAGSLRIEVIPDPNPNPNASSVGGTVKAWTNTNVQPKAALKNVPVHNLRVGTAYTDANGKFTLSGSSQTVTIRFQGRYSGTITAAKGTTYSRTVTLTGSNNQIQIYTSSAGEYDRSQSTCYYFTNASNLYVRGIIGNKSQMSRLDSISSTVNYNASCNAIYSNYTMRFYNAASSCTNTAYNSVVMHEWGHGLDHAFGGIQRNQGMSEGSADTVPMLYNDDPYIGHGWRGGAFLRSGTNTKTYPPSGSVHSQGEVWMGFCWDARNQLVASLGKAAGLTQARKLLVGVFVANPTSQPNGVREVALIDDNDGNLNNGTPNCKALIAAITKRKIANPISNCSSSGIPGLYTFYGSGCKGTGGSSGGKCHSQNMSCGTPRNGGNTNVFATPFKVASTTVATGAKLRTGNSGRFNIEIWRTDAAGKPTSKLSGTGSITIGSAYATYSGNFSTPVVLAAGNYALVHNRVSGSSHHPICPGGTPTTHYWHPPSGSTWSGPWNTQGWAFEVICGGGGGGKAVPLLTSTGVPVAGRSFQLNVSQAKKGARAFILFGAATTSINLGGIGAAGCVVQATPSIAAGFNIASTGSGSLSVNVPNNTSLIKKSFYNQGVVLDSGANKLGVALTRGGKGTVGKQ